MRAGLGFVWGSSKLGKGQSTFSSSFWVASGRGYASVFGATLRGLGEGFCQAALF